MRITFFVLIAILGGIFVAGSLAEGRSSQAVISAGIAIMLIGALQFVMSAARLLVYEQGIERRGRFGTKRMAWNNLRTYRLQIIDTAMAAGGAGGLLGALIARAVVRAVRKNTELVPNAVTLLGQDGAKVVLAPNVAGFGDLLKTLLPSLTDRLFPVARQAYETGAEVSFGKKLAIQRGIGITFTGRFGKKVVLPLEQAANANIEGTTLVIRRNDTNAVWQSVQAGSVDNLGVFQKFVATVGKPYDDRLPMAWTS